MIKKSTYILQLRTYVRVYIGFFYTVIRHRSPQLRTADSEGITGLQVILPNRYVGTYVGTTDLRLTRKTEMGGMHKEVQAAMKVQ